ncbi:hypothetical protein MOX02_60720 [Methylobacterium oxalidis]|uniref:Uncharacterized protein n=1 Tax=Methylobacterium oxalidis TaxID=944322 RepID=A0A512JDK5_9HYPH|nr:hypothetical protein MOX02_60720 [Methylobacterium oxalidis]GLS63838.1 hypothetical protein GCM10007888_22190 [Methylobacterium oxalidis]
MSRTIRSLVPRSRAASDWVASWPLQTLCSGRVFRSHGNPMQDFTALDHLKATAIKLSHALAVKQ